MTTTEIIFTIGGIYLALACLALVYTYIKYEIEAYKEDQKSNTNK
jgi:hypothetical protein